MCVRSSHAQLLDIPDGSCSCGTLHVGLPPQACRYVCMYRSRRPFAADPTCNGPLLTTTHILASSSSRGSGASMAGSANVRGTTSSRLRWPGLPATRCIPKRLVRDGAGCLRAPREASQLEAALSESRHAMLRAADRPARPAGRPVRARHRTGGCRQRPAGAATGPEAWAAGARRSMLIGWSQCCSGLPGFRAEAVVVPEACGGTCGDEDKRRIRSGFSGS